MLSINEAQNTLQLLIPDDIKQLSRIFNDAGFDLFLVGGCIRDVFLNKVPKDFDLSTNAMPDVIIELLTDNKIKNQLRGVDFGVVVAQMSEEMEIATFRSDVDSIDNRHTTVKLGVTIKEDVERRDITINGLFFDLNENKIIDLVGGVDDLKNGIIRCIGNPEQRFEEDHLRKLRVIRFAARTGFTIDALTLRTIVTNPTLNIAPDRIFDELLNMCKSGDVKKIDVLLNASGLIDNILNGFEISAVSPIKPTNISTLIASYIPNNALKISDRLVDLKFDRKIANNIEFLSKLTNGKITHPLDFISGRKKTNLTDDEIRCTDSKLIERFLEFKPTPMLSKTLMAKGFSGKDLGDKIREIELHNFLNVF